MLKGIRITVGDVIVLVLCIALVTASYVWFWRPTAAAGTVDVYHGRTLLRSLSLQRDTQLQVRGDIGATQLDIQQGKVRFSHAPCTNQICVQAGWASHQHDALHCLPNRISVVLRGNAAQGEAELDGVSY